MKTSFIIISPFGKSSIVEWIVSSPETWSFSVSKVLFVFKLIALLDKLDLLYFVLPRKLGLRKHRPHTWTAVKF